MTTLRDALERAALADEVAFAALDAPGVSDAYRELLCAQASAVAAEVLDLLVGPCRAAGPLPQSHAPVASVVVGRGRGARVLRLVDGRG